MDDFHKQQTIFINSAETYFLTSDDFQIGCQCNFNRTWESRFWIEFICLLLFFFIVSVILIFIDVMYTLKKNSLNNVKDENW